MTEARHGPGSRIPVRQNEPRHLERLRAYSHLYDLAQRWRRLRITGTVGLAVLGPVLALVSVETHGVLAAISATWLVLGRAVLVRLENNARDEAVQVQELFDVGLFELSWNTTVAGPEPVPDDVVRAARALPDHPRFRDWYDVDLINTAWPADVLLCQRQSMAWSRGDHRAYAKTLAVGAAGWLLLGMIVALVRDMSLADYLVKIFLPTAPALLDAVELHAAHRRISGEREARLAQIDAIARAHLAGQSSVTSSDCRQIQDAAHLLRSTTPRVPGWFYFLRRRGSQADTAAAHRALNDDTES